MFLGVLGGVFGVSGVFSFFVEHFTGDFAF
jgi:hypothetical protein